MLNFTDHIFKKIPSHNSKSWEHEPKLRQKSKHDHYLTELGATRLLLYLATFIAFQLLDM